MASSEGPRSSDERVAQDGALPFQLDALGVRGRLVRLGPSLDAVIERHGYPLAVARPLAEAMVLCAALATSLKYDGIFTLQISGDGPIRLLVTDLTTDGALRGYAQFDSWKLAVALGAGHNGDAPEGYVPKLFGRGRLAFTVDQGQHTQRYQGVVPLEGALSASRRVVALASTLALGAAGLLVVMGAFGILYLRLVAQRQLEETL